jgi:hypothetical protein
MASITTGSALTSFVVSIICIVGCTTTGGNMKRDFQPARQYTSGDPGNKGYKFEKTSQFIEFCVELDSQDDRLPNPKDPNHDPMNPNFHQQINPKLWNPDPIYDSRKEVANDVIDFKNSGESKTEGNKGWVKLYRKILARASKEPPLAWTKKAFFDDARYNGFGPYQSAWLLYEGT